MIFPRRLPVANAFAAALLLVGLFHPIPASKRSGGRGGHGHRGGRGPAPRQLHAPARRDALHPGRRRRRIYRQRGPRGGDPYAGIHEPRGRSPLPPPAAEGKPRGPAAYGRRHAPHPGADAGQDASPPRRLRAVHPPEQLRRDRPLRNPHRAVDAGEPVPPRRHAGPPVPVLLRHRRPLRPARGERAGHRGDRRARLHDNGSYGNYRDKAFDRSSSS